MDSRRYGAPLNIPSLLLAAALAGGAGCASQVTPSGGPEDTVPPSIVVSSPGPGELNFGAKVIRLEFSEYVDRRSLQESAYLSPSPGGLRFEWGGREVEISYDGELRPQTTYILTVGTDLKDTRNNRLASAFILAFSTGGTIDSCSVEGRVHDAAPGGVMVLAYDVAGGRSDTLNPARVKPDYLTQTGADGRFTLRSMKEGRYRLMALRDIFRDLLYNPQTDRYSMAAADLLLEAGRRAAAGIDFRLTAEDTLRPFISALRARDRTSVSVRFNEAVALPAGARDALVTDTADGGGLSFFDFAPVDTSLREYIATTGPQRPGAVYRLTLGAFADERGNPADSAGRTGVFSAGLSPDTLPPVLLLSVARDSLTGVSPHDTLRLTFDEPVDTVAVTSGFRIDGPAVAPLPGRLRWSGSMMASFEPGQPFVPGGWYAVSIELDSVRDRAGNASRDSTLVRRFRITEEKFLGSIAGVVDAVGVPAMTDGDAAVIVQAAALSGPGARRLSVRADRSGKFIFDRLTEGLYALSAFIDLDGNGGHDAGLPHPPRFAEPFGTYPDTLKVRPGWPVEGVKIEIGR